VCRSLHATNTPHTTISCVTNNIALWYHTRKNKRKSARVRACSRVMQDVMGEMVEEGDEGKGRGTHALCHRPSARRATRPPQESLPPHAHPHRPRTHPHSRPLPPPHLRRPPLGRLRRGLLNARGEWRPKRCGGCMGGGGGRWRRWRGGQQLCDCVACSLLSTSCRHKHTRKHAQDIAPAHGKQAHIEHWHAHVTWLSTCKPETGQTDLPSPWRPRGDRTQTPRAPACG